MCKWDEVGQGKEGVCLLLIHAAQGAVGGGVNSPLICTMTSSGVQTVVLQMSMEKENSIHKAEELGAHSRQVMYPLSNRITYHFLSSMDTDFPWLKLVFVKTFWGKINAAGKIKYQS